VEVDRTTILGAALLSLTAGCVFPQRHRLPEIHGRLLDGGVPVGRAKVGYCWGWSKETCNDALQEIAPAAAGLFILPQQSKWGVGFITPIPDYGRAGWQLCFESLDGRRRYFRTWWEGGGVANLTCDIGLAETVDACSWLPSD